MCNCDEGLELISASLDGTLITEEQMRLEEHLASCEGCRALSQELASLHELMPEEVEVPAGLHEGIMARVAAEQIIPFAPKPKKKRIWQTWAPMAAVFAIVLAGAGVSMRMGYLGGAGGNAAAPAQAALSPAPSAAPSTYGIAGSSEGAAEPSAAPTPATQVGDSGEITETPPQTPEEAEASGGSSEKSTAVQNEIEVPQGVENTAQPRVRTYGPGFQGEGGEPASMDAEPAPEPEPNTALVTMPASGGGSGSSTPVLTEEERQAADQAIAWLAASDLENKESVDVTQVRVEMLTGEQRSAAVCDEGREAQLDETDLLVTLGDTAGEYAQVICDSTAGEAIGYLPITE